MTLVFGIFFFSILGLAVSPAFFWAAGGCLALLLVAELLA